MDQMVSNRAWGEMRGRVWNRWCRILYGGGVRGRVWNRWCRIMYPVPYTTSHLTSYTIRHHLFRTRPRISPHTRFDTTCSIHDLASHPIHDSTPPVPCTTSHLTTIHDSICDEMRGRVWTRWCQIVHGVRCEVVYGTGGVESCMG
jgi:hypothetical protein